MKNFVGDKHNMLVRCQRRGCGTWGTVRVYRRRARGATLPLYCTVFYCTVLCVFVEEEMWHLGYSDGVQEDGPGARHSHSAVVHDQAMWVFGGMCDLQPRNDFWKWSFGKNLDPTGHCLGRPP